MSELRDLFRSARSAVVQAGAGTGKTHNLVTLCLHVLSGVGRAEPLPPARLWAVTFTEKAAAELKGRIRQRIDRLAECAAGNVEAIEPELWASTEGMPPPAALWRRVRRDLGLAQIGTLHSLCAQILRRHAPAAGLDPQFAVLDELEAQRLRDEACSGAALDALEPGSPLRDSARRLCAELGFRGAGRFGRGVGDELIALLRATAETGRGPAKLVEAAPALDPAAAGAAFESARTAFLSSLAALEDELRAARKRRAPSQTAMEALAAVEAFRAAGAPAARAVAGELGTASAGLARLRDALQPRGNGAEMIRDARDKLTAFLEADAQARSCRLARDLALLADDAERRYRAEKHRAGAVDFDDLTRLARDLLASDAGVRRSEKSRLGLLLVDEFQDTSRTQLELIGLLCGEGDAVLPACSGSPGAPPLAAGALVVVGDRKQSIYEFRGADVAGAQAFAAQALRDGAAHHVLRTSRRSRPALVRLANALFRVALAPASRPFETPFGDDDVLDAHREEGPPGACAELLHVTGAGVEAEAEVVARRVARLLAPGAPERVFDSPAGRPVRGGDVAILLRRFTNVDVFRRALLRRRIPHLVFKGKGFFDAREVVDLVSLLSVAVDPDDALSLAAVLRSPLGPVSDDGLVLLAAHGGHGLRLRSARDPEARARLAPDDAVAVEQIVGLIERLEREADRLGPAALLEAALAETDYVARAAAGLYGEQAAANVDKLLALARRHELRGGSTRAFVALVRTLAEEEASEADAAVVEDRDPHAVRILTVHAAKGLEFPVVIVPECAAPAPPIGQRLLVDPDLGVALKVRGADGRLRWGVQGLRIKDQREARDAAQSRRLLYVAATRARDYLVFSGRAAKGESWRSLLDAALPQLGELVRVLPDGGEGADPAPPPPGALVDRFPELLRALESAAPVEASADGRDRFAAWLAADMFEAARQAIARAEAPQLGADATLVAPVTQLADASACARRYQLLHEIGLEEHPRREGDGGADAAALGTLAHRLLEVAPLDAGAGELSRALALEGADPDSPEHVEVLQAAQAFLRTPLARRMAAAAPGRLQRELPFALRIDGEDGPSLVVRGQLDALLLDDGEALVVDYKLSRGAHGERYAFQLDAYALAAHALTGGEVPVRSGLVLLRARGAPCKLDEPRTPDQLDRIRDRLRAAARVLADGRRTGVWPKIEPARCRAIECGFLRRCHREEERTLAAC